jgi:RNA polymerase sigma factor (sigma-70 family)
MDLAQKTDEELMVLTQQGDAAAYEALFKRHDRAVYGFLLRKTRRPEYARELFQETWLKVHRGRHTYRSGQAFRPWLYGIALNATRDAGRQANRRVDTVELSIDKPVAAERHADRLTLEHAIDQLPDTLRDAFLLGAVHGLDHREVAEQLDISPDNARARISRARAFLRDHLGKHA